MEAEAVISITVKTEATMLNYATEVQHVNYEEERPKNSSLGNIMNEWYSGGFVLSNSSEV